MDHILQNGLSRLREAIAFAFSPGSVTFLDFSIRASTFSSVTGIPFVRTAAGDAWEPCASPGVSDVSALPPPHPGQNAPGQQPPAQGGDKLGPGEHDRQHSRLLLRKPRRRQEPGRWRPKQLQIPYKTPVQNPYFCSFHLRVIIAPGGARKKFFLAGSLEGFQPSNSPGTFCADKKYLKTA